RPSDPTSNVSWNYLELTPGRSAKFVALRALTQEAIPQGQHYLPQQRYQAQSQIGQLSPLPLEYYLCCRRYRVQYRRGQRLRVYRPIRSPELARPNLSASNLVQD